MRFLDDKTHSHKNETLYAFKKFPWNEAQSGTYGNKPRWQLVPPKTLNLSGSWLFCLFYALEKWTEILCPMLIILGYVLQLERTIALAMGIFYHFSIVKGWKENTKRGAIANVWFVSIQFPNVGSSIHII